MTKLLPLLLLLATSTAVAAPKQKNVAIVVYDHMEILDFAGPAEVLAAASRFAGSGGQPALNIYLVGKTTKPLEAQGFIDITPAFSIDNAPSPDIVVIPGGMSDNLSNDPAMMAWLTQATAASDTTLTVCTGAFPLAKAGVFDGMEITTYYGAIEGLRALAPKARVTHGRRFIDNGRYITTAGVSAGIDGALHLAARIFGRRVADQTARYMEYHWTPEPYLATGYAYWNPSVDARGRLMQQAEAAVEEKKLGDAIAIFEKLTKTDTDGSAWLGLGNTRYHARDYRGAINAYVRVTEKQPGYKIAIYNLACTYALVGEKQKAIVAVKKALLAGIDKAQALGDADLASIKSDIQKL